MHGTGDAPSNTNSKKPNWENNHAETTKYD
jgi:hypothetical protein